MRAFHQLRVLQRDDVEERALAELSLREPPADGDGRKADGRIDEKLDGVVAGLAVDIDGARVVGGALVVEPEIIAEPAVGLRDRHQLAGARMIEPGDALSLLVEHQLDAVQPAQEFRDRRNAFGRADIDVRELMVGDREGL